MYMTVVNRQIDNNNYTYYVPFDHWIQVLIYITLIYVTRKYILKVGKILIYIIKCLKMHTYSLIKTYYIMILNNCIR